MRQSAELTRDYGCGGGTLSRSDSSSFAGGWFSFGPSLGGASSTDGSVIFHGFADLVAALFSFAFDDFFEVWFDFVLLFFFVLVVDDFFGSPAAEDATGRGISLVSSVASRCTSVRSVAVNDLLDCSSSEA
ncbi:MAG: hypothetical protein ACJ8HQ_01250, partial [Chthoniobacterales bacterium]